MRRSPPHPAARPLVAGLLLALLLAPGAFAEVYRWTDAEGRMHFTQSLNEVPAKYRKQAQKRALEDDRPSRVQTYAAPPAAPSRRSPAAGRPIHVPFERHGTLMRVRARVNDSVEAPFLIDTGASGIALPQWVADRLGLQVGPDTTWVRTQTANGLVARPLVMLDAVEVGGARVENLPATINPTMPFGLLGGAFLHNFVYRVDAAAGVITLLQNESVAGGLSEAQWRHRFRDLREAIARIDDHRARIPETHRTRHADLAERRAELVEHLDRLETEANRLGVPHAWR